MPLTPSKTRQILESIGHTPQKKLGQNFLIDGNIVRKSLDLAAVSSTDTIVEVGPGLGTLTQTLLKTGATVYAIEKDPRLHQYLCDTLVPEFPNSLKLTLGDALDLPLQHARSS
jgi:Dimethyladenosine transferase (rRNA methylation)